MYILLHTKFDQPRVARKHLTKLAKNGMAAVTYIAILLAGFQVFGMVLAVQNI